MDGCKPLHEGVASTYLARFVPYGAAAGNQKVNGVATAMLGVRVSLFVRTSTFKLPRDPATPVVMIGPGTGYAPFRVGTDAQHSSRHRMPFISRNEELKRV